jgi:hypothetical protein
MAGGRLSSGGYGAGPLIDVSVRISGVEKTSQEFKDARRDVNRKLRQAIQTAGERAVLPQIKRGFGSRTFGASLFVKKDRTTVFIGSKLRGSLNRAVGWWDFGGQRPRDHARRKGRYTIVRMLQARRPIIDRAILEALDDTFRPLDFKRGV